MAEIQPLITIITVVYNGAAHLEETIENVLGQQYHNLEFIIIDGGSTDATVSIIEKYAHKLAYWISEPDQGIYDAMNKGWEKAASDSYILYLGAGDKIMALPDLSLIQQKPDVIVGDVYLGNKLLFQSKVDFRLKLGNTIHHQAMLVKKDKHPAPPFSLQYKTYGDFDFNQRLYKSKSRFLIDKNFVSYALEGGVSAKFNKNEALQIVKNNFGLLYVCLAYMYYLLRKEA